MSAADPEVQHLANRIASVADLATTSLVIAELLELLRHTGCSCDCGCDYDGHEDACHPCLACATEGVIRRRVKL